MKGIVTSGIVLGRTNFGEADRILTILTPDHGKIRVMAKGVRRSNSKLAAGVELLSVAHITFIPPKKEIGTLISSRLQQHYGKIVEDIDRTNAAYAVMRQVDRLTEDGAGGEFFGPLQSILYGLNEPKLSLEVLQIWFGLHLLIITGHTPNLEKDNDGQTLQQDESYTFDFESMSFAPHKAGMFQASHIKLLRVLQRQKDTDRLEKLEGIEAVLPACLQLTTAMLQQQHLAVA